MPGELGGGGLSSLDRVLCEGQFGHTTDYLVRRAFGNVYEPLLECKGPQIDRWLRPAVEGARTCAIAFTESGAGSDAAGITTRARKTDAGWVLNGSKQFISDGERSDFFLVSAKTGEKEISMFMADKGLDAREQIAMVKVFTAETLGRMVDRAVQVFGGMGYCRELPIERYYRDARVYRIFDGTSEIHRTVIAKSTLKKGAVLFDLHR